MLLVKYFERQFFNGISMKTDKAVTRQARQQYSKLIHAEQHLAVDRATQLNLAFVALATGSYEVLKERMSREEAMDVIRFALYERTQQKQQRFMKLFLKWSRDPFAHVVKISKIKQIKHYGDKSFTHEISSDSPQEFQFRVKKCFYFNFFRSHGVPELGVVFCELDNVWGDLLVGGTYGVIFNRPTTIATGHEDCLFCFYRTTEKPAQ